MTYMGIDPAYKKPHAYSIWMDGKLVDVGKVQFMCEMWALLNKYKPDLVLIEDQYLHYNYKTSKALTFRSGMLAGICEYLSFEYEIVNVAIWTSRLEIYKGIEKGVSIYKRKLEKIRRLNQYASQFWDVQDEDEASAILIPYAIKIKERS